MSVVNALTECGLKLERILGGLSHNDIRLNEESVCQPANIGLLDTQFVNIRLNSDNEHDLSIQNIGPSISHK